MNRKIMIAALVLLAALVFVSCQDEADPLVGRWTNGFATLEFKANGDFSANVMGTPQKGTWKVSGGKLVITMVGYDPSAEDYTVNGDTLCLGDGPFNVYTRM